MSVATKGSHNAARGYSLLEFSVVLAVLGLLFVGFVSYWAASQRAEVARQQQALMVRAEQSLVGFLYANARLPCPDTDGNGLEDCGTGQQKGFLAWRTLGLPALGAEALRYGVYRDSANGHDLAAANHRFEPYLITANTPVEANLLDTCYALDVIAEKRVNTASDNETDTDFLHISDDTVARNVAYVIGAPGASDRDGDGDAFDGRQPSADPVFDRPSRGRSATYDDRVSAAGFEALGNFLNCSEALAAIGHTHFNAANASRMMAKTLADYTELLKLQKSLADASLMSAGAGIASSAGGFAGSTASVALSIAQTIGTYGTLSPTIAFSVGSIITSGISVGISTAGFVTAGLGVEAARKRVERSETEQAKANTLAGEIEENAKKADRKGF